MTQQPRLPIADVLAKFPDEVLLKYDFLHAVYNGGVAPITGIGCPRHGTFQQYPAQLRRLDGAHCPKCGDEVRRAKQRVPQDEFVRRAIESHNGAYTYEKAVFLGTAKKVEVTCPEHGSFWVTPNNHLKRLSGNFRPRGCPTCGAAKRGHRKDVMSAGRATADAKLAKFAEQFVNEAKAIHGDAYDYSKSVYQGRRTALTIICPDHGAFEQTPMKHLDRAQGCPECSHHRSKGESEIKTFVSIFAKVRDRDRTILAPKELDIYVPDHKLAIEFCGEYWHGADTPEDEPFARRRHAEKFKACEALGIRLLTVYWSEWGKRAPQIKRIIRNALGKSKGRVGARDCSVEAVGNTEAAAFFDRFHIQGGSGFGTHYGLRYKGKLVACMRFTHGANDRGAAANRVWTLSRYATRIGVTGGAGRLLAAFMEAERPEEIKSFSDNRFFDGSMYAHLGFSLDEEIEQDYQVYHQRLGLMPKSAWQRRLIPARIRELGSKETFDPETDPRSERDMTFLLGALRLYDCGKKRWVWRAPAHDLV